MTETLYSIRLVADSAMLMLIWLVQLIIYPAFYSIPSELFPDWHSRYMRTISIFVIPLMITQAACIGMQLLHDSSLIDLMSGIAVLGAWLVTFTISAPCHQRLQRDGKQADIIRRLITTNWFRTACWSIAWLLGLWAH